MKEPIGSIEEYSQSVLQTTELVANLMYCLRTDIPSQKWLTKSQVDTLLDGGRREAAFLGLMQQRLGSVKGIGLLSSKGIADLVKLTIKDLPILADTNEADSLQAKDTLAFYRKASFAVSTLNRVLELPLVVDFKNPAYYTPLKNRSEGLKQIPETSERALDFIYYINIKDHGKAISSLIRLFTSLELSTESKKDGKRKSAIHYLQNTATSLRGS